METLLAILKAAHCKSTHHYFALDSLLEVQSAPGQLLANLLLAHHQEYLTGAKDPDNVFKDFENHVLHVRDKFWGGAARTAARWYEKSRNLIEQGKSSEAAYAIGVLSHYFSDPFMPLHTGQSERETVVHRPMEWSVKCAYQEIYELAASNAEFASFELSQEEDWLTEAIQRGASQVNFHYETLIDQYNMAESAKQPALALNRKSKWILAEIFTLVLTGWGAVIDRLASQVPNSIPEKSLTPATLIASLQVPSQMILKKIDSVKQRSEVTKIFEEYQTTGKVVRNLTPEQRVVTTLRNRDPELIKLKAERAKTGEIPKPIAMPPPANPYKAVPAIEREEAPVELPRSTSLPKKFADVPLVNKERDEEEEPPTVPDPIPLPRTMESPTPRPVFTPAPTPKAPVPTLAQVPIHAPVPVPAEVEVVRRRTDLDPPKVKPSPPKPAIQTVVASAPRRENREMESDSTKDSDYRLHYDSPIVDAPSIGPKTAARFHEIGCNTVRDFLSINPEDVAAKLNTKWITADLVDSWQKQSELMCGVERLTAAASILMVLAEIETPDQLASIDPPSLAKLLDDASQTHIGKRALRDAPPPPIERLTYWIDSARRNRR